MKHNFSKWKYKEVGFWMDGGSITIHYINDLNEESIISLQQDMITDFYEEISKIPGRIYLDDELIEKRSFSEKQIVELLEQTIKEESEFSNVEIIIEKIKWIKSESYLEFTPQKLILSDKRKKYLLSKKKIK